MAKNRAVVLTKPKSNFLDANISGAKWHCHQKISQSIEADKRLLLHTPYVRMGPVYPQQFFLENSKTDQNFGVR